MVEEVCPEGSELVLVAFDAFSAVGAAVDDDYSDVFGVGVVPRIFLISVFVGFLIV